MQSRFVVLPSGTEEDIEPKNEDEVLKEITTVHGVYTRPTGERKELSPDEEVPEGIKIHKFVVSPSGKEEEIEPKNEPKIC